jgi:hypothetical protein
VTLAIFADHVCRQVPMISQRVFGERQRPHNKIADDFPLGVRTAALSPSATEADIPKSPTYLLICPDLVREKCPVGAPGGRQLSPGIQVRVVEFSGAWSIIARDGDKRGYVPAAAPLQ